MKISQENLYVDIGTERVKIVPSFHKIRLKQVPNMAFLIIIQKTGPALTWVTNDAIFCC